MLSVIWAHLCLADVSYSEHELEDAIPASNASRVRDEDGPGTLLRLANASKYNAQGDCIQHSSPDRLQG